MPTGELLCQYPHITSMLMRRYDYRSVRVGAEIVILAKLLTDCLVLSTKLTVLTTVSLIYEVRTPKLTFGCPGIHRVHISNVC